MAEKARKSQLAFYRKKPAKVSYKPASFFTEKARKSQLAFYRKKPAKVSLKRSEKEVCDTVAQMKLANRLKKKWLIKSLWKSVPNHSYSADHACLRKKVGPGGNRKRKKKMKDERYFWASQSQNKKRGKVQGGIANAKKKNERRKVFLPISIANY